MAQYIKTKLPKDCKLLVTGCVHVGSKMHHKKGFKLFTDRLEDERNTYGALNGDAVEGKPVGSKHFEPEGLVPGLLTPGSQFNYFRKCIEGSADKWLFLGTGNHDRYLSKDVDLLKDLVADPLGIPIGGYQTYVWFGNGSTGFFWHGFPSMPRGAKDPIQREANQRAWLKNKMEGLHSAHLNVMGHLHNLMVQPPLNEMVLGMMADGSGIAKEVLLGGVPDQVVGKKRILWVPKESRWYAMNGTLRRGGCMGFTDYSEVAGYPPADIGFLEVTFADGRIRAVEPIHV